MQLTPFTLEDEIATIDRCCPNPEHREVLHAAVRAFYRCQERDAVLDDDLASFRAAMAHPNSAVWFTAAGWLEKMAPHLPAVLGFLRELAGDKAGVTRLNVCATVGQRRLPREFKVELLRRFLDDRSARVREAAADGCERSGLTELLPDLKRASEDPKNAALRKPFAFAIALLERGIHEADGHVTEKRPDGSYAVW